MQAYLSGSDGGGMSGKVGGRGMSGGSEGGGIPQQGMHLLGCCLLIVFPTQLQQLCLCGLQRLEKVKSRVRSPIPWRWNPLLQRWKAGGGLG